MSVKTEIARISEAKAAIRESIEKKGQTIAADAKIDTFSAVIDLLSYIDGAACGKFTWDGNYPIVCDCSNMESAPTSFLLYCPYLVNLGVEKCHALVAAKGINAMATSALLKVTAKNTAAISTTVLSSFTYDEENKAIKIQSVMAGELLRGQDYYWIAV